MFCETALMAFPALTLVAKGNESGIENPYDSTDSIMDDLADELVRVTADGAQNGFKSEHFRRYAGFMRMLDAQMESRGTNKEANKRLDDDDFHRLNPIKSARFISEYWRKRNLDFREDELLTIDWKSYLEGKKEIKKMGGVRALNSRVALLFEFKAQQYETAAFYGGPYIRQGRIAFPRQPEKPLFVNAQFSDLLSIVPSNSNGSYTPELAEKLLNFLREHPGLLDSSFSSIDFSNPIFSGVAGLSILVMGAKLDCLCKAMSALGAFLALLCVFALCGPCCAPAAALTALEKLLETFHVCDPKDC